MPKKRCSPEEIIQHIRTLEIEQAKGATLEAVVKKIAVTPQTLIRWKAEYAGLRVDQVKKLKELEQENSRLKRLVADKELDILILKEACRGN